MIKSSIAEIFISPHRYNKQVSISLSFDDFTTFDLKAEMYLKKHNLKATVFLNTYYLSKIERLLGDRFTRLWREISESGTIDYSSHSVTHQGYPKIGKTDLDIRCRKELEESRNTISLIFKKRPIGFAYPYGETRMQKFLSQYYLFGRGIYTKDTRYLEIKNGELSHIGVAMEPLEDIFINKKENELIRIIETAKTKCGWIRLYGHLKVIERLKLWDRVDWLLDYISTDNELYCGNFEEVASYLYLSKKAKLLDLSDNMNNGITRFKVVNDIDKKIKELIDIDRIKLTIVLKFYNNFSNFAISVDGVDVPVIHDDNNHQLFWFEVDCRDHIVKIKQDSSNPLGNILTSPKITDISSNRRTIYFKVDRPSDAAIYYKKEGKDCEYLMLTRETKRETNHCLKIPLLDYAWARLLPGRFRFIIVSTDNSGLSSWADNGGRGYLCSRVPLRITWLLSDNLGKYIVTILTSIIMRLLYLMDIYGGKRILAVMISALGLSLIGIVLAVLR
jgi:peptidoglycan/xylan/chitin deacetylase (PgdA/CDA1 family)